MNNILLVGRITKIEEKETSAERTLAIVTIAIERHFKNVNGEYENDFIDCTLWNSIASSTLEYCKKGDVIAVHGRLQKSESDNDMRVIVEKVSYLKQGKEEK